MKILGITGGIGAGKSAVLSCMEQKYGACVVQADQVAHRLQQPGGDCYAAIVSRFGDGILREDKTIDRGALAALVFSDAGLLAQLNGIVHPAVKKWITEEIARKKAQGDVPLFVIEAALLLEDHYDRICEEIWYIYADYDVRIRRLTESRGYTKEKARRIMANQLPDEEYREKCRVVIDNSGDFYKETQKQIDRELRRLSGGI